MTDTLPAVTVDAYGITDRGLVRSGNEDHFLIARVSKAIEVRQTSMPSDQVEHELGGAVGHVLAVADGVGGGPEGELASERTLAAQALRKLGQPRSANVTEPSRSPSACPRECALESEELMVDTEGSSNEGERRLRELRRGHRRARRFPRDRGARDHGTASRKGAA